MNEKLIDLAIKASTPTKKAIKSAIHDHEVETGHSIGWNNWKLLNKDQKHYSLLVRESIPISKYHPSLNKTVC